MDARVRAIGACIGDDEGMVIVHQWMGEGFEHVTDGSRPCLCNPYRFPADDPRTLEEILDDIDEHERKGDH